MVNSAVTVFMPVYNGEKYIKQAIASILGQTYPSFELLIIDDCSTDASRSIIQSYDDARIRLVVNEHNLGLIRTLNIGLNEAKGKYFARMDQDDIAEPDRLLLQSQYLDNHPDCGVVGSTVRLIDQRGIVTGEWSDDVRRVSNADIKRYLPRANCLAHPTIMGRTALLKHYSYNERQHHAEDYDLWLRLAADDVHIEKISQPLLRYRIHQASMTQQSLQPTGLGKNTRTKGQFLMHQLRQVKLNTFFWQVAWQYGKDLFQWFVYSVGGVVYRIIKKIIRSAGRQLGYLVAQWYSLDNPGGYFFFFHSYGVGGAEFVHAQIVETVANKKPFIIFTNSVKTTSSLLAVYKKFGTVLDLSKSLASMFGYSLYLGIVAKNINRQTQPIVFGSISRFFYELLPLLQPHVRTIDLTHAFDGASEHFTIQYVPYLQHRIVINHYIYADLLDYYATRHLTELYSNRLQVIENGVEVPTVYSTRQPTPFQILYLGRGTYEKRVHLIGQIAQRCLQNHLAVQFTLVGNIPDTTTQHYKDYCIFKKEIVDSKEKNQLLNTAHLLIMTSSREGFPISVMEAMAHGVVPLVTNVGGISCHITHGTTGLLIDNANEAYVIETMVNTIKYYSQHITAWHQLSKQAYHYASEHFSLANFQQRYQQLFRSVEHL